MQKTYTIFLNFYLNFYLIFIIFNKILKNLIIWDKYIIDKVTFKQIIKNI
jgi:hypothetical protein